MQFLEVWGILGKILLAVYAVLVGMFGNKIKLLILTLFVFIYKEGIYPSIYFPWPNNSIACGLVQLKTLSILEW